ncbi:hypothetical protein, partial [Brevibacterium aurantiacum]
FLGVKSLVGMPPLYGTHPVRTRSILTNKQLCFHCCGLYRKVAAILQLSKAVGSVASEINI